MIPAVAATFLVRFGQQQGLRAPPRTHGLYASWEDMAALLEWANAGIEAFPARYAEHLIHTFPMIRWLSLHVVSPRGLHRAALFAWRRIWRAVELEAAELENGVIVRASLTPGATPCETYFRLAAEVERRLPTLIAEPQARVVAQVSGVGGQYHVTFAPRRNARRAGDGDEPAPELIFNSLARAGLMLSPPTAPLAWGLTDAEGRVVNKLVDGQTLRQAAEDLGIGYETARTHLKRAMAKAGVRRQVELITAAIGAGT